MISDMKGKSSVLGINRTSRAVSKYINARRGLIETLENENVKPEIVSKT
jgi:hypothetical protein